MGLFELFLLAVGLSMDAFAVSICKGLSLPGIKPNHMIKAGLWFGGFQALMPTIGYFLGELFADLVAKYAHWIGFLLLLYIGSGMIRESRDKEEADDLSAAMDAKTMFLLAVATSIDAFAVGISFAFLRVAILPAASFIGCVTFVFSAAGVKVGSLFGDRYKSKAELTGGIILILLGVRVLLQGLGIL